MICGAEWSGGRVSIVRNHDGPSVYIFRTLGAASARLREGGSLHLLLRSVLRCLELRNGPVC